MKNIISLEIPNDLTALAGENLAKQIAEEQIIDKLSKTKENEILFPDHIIVVISSFMETLHYAISKYSNNIVYKSNNNFLNGKLNQKDRFC